MSERNLDFDAVIDRRGTKCLKYDFAVQRGRPADVLPLWVADMDFKTSSYIEDALIRQAQHAIYGYTESAGGACMAAENAWHRLCHSGCRQGLHHARGGGADPAAGLLPVQ